MPSSGVFNDEIDSSACLDILMNQHVFISVELVTDVNVFSPPDHQAEDR